MAKVDLGRTLGKALRRGAQYAAVAAVAVAGVPVPDDVGISDKATVVFGLAIIGAVVKAIHNYSKTKARPVNLGSSSGYVLALAALSLALAGCVTTTGPDGTTTTQIDPVVLETSLTRYDRYVARKELLKKEKVAAQKAQDARCAAIVQAEIDKLEPEIARLAERLGL